MVDLIFKMENETNVVILNIYNNFHGTFIVNVHYLLLH